MFSVTPTAAGNGAVVIRLATSADIDELRRLAALDSARALLGTVLVAESDGRIRAAYSMDEQRAVADPFVPSAGLVDLLETRADLLRDAPPRGTRRQGRLRLIPARP